jgi:hypothetical protein
VEFATRCRGWAGVVDREMRAEPRGIVRGLEREMDGRLGCEVARGYKKKDIPLLVCLGIDNKQYRLELCLALFNFIDLVLFLIYLYPFSPVDTRSRTSLSMRFSVVDALLWSSTAVSAQSFVSPPRNTERKLSERFPGASITYKECSLCETTKDTKSYSGYVHIPKKYLPDATDWEESQSAHLFFWYFRESRSQVSRVWSSEICILTSP